MSDQNGQLLVDMISPAPPSDPSPNDIREPFLRVLELARGIHCGEIVFWLDLPPSEEDSLRMIIYFDRYMGDAAKR